jgi:hypothetical protein
MNRKPNLGDIVVSRTEHISAIIENIMSLPSPRMIVRSIRDGRLYTLPINSLGVSWDIVT